MVPRENIIAGERLIEAKTNETNLSQTLRRPKQNPLWKELRFLLFFFDVVFAITTIISNNKAKEASFVADSQ